MRLHFLNFDVETDNDDVHVYDGSDYKAQHLQTFSGTSRPSDVFSTGNFIFVTFFTDATNTQGGFKVEYTTSTGT